MPPATSFIGVIDDIVKLPLSLLVERVVPGSPFTGAGNLTRPSGPVGVNAWGLAWSFVTIPPYLGVANGAVPTWNKRLLQLATFSQSRDTVHPVQIADIHYDSGVFLWGGDLPSYVGYYLTPGVVAQFRWLLFTFG